MEMNALTSSNKSKRFADESPPTIATVTVVDCHRPRQPPTDASILQDSDLPKQSGGHLYNQSNKRISTVAHSYDHNKNTKIISSSSIPLQLLLSAEYLQLPDLDQLSVSDLVSFAHSNVQFLRANDAATVLSCICKKEASTVSVCNKNILELLALLELRADVLSTRSVVTSIACASKLKFKKPSFLQALSSVASKKAANFNEQEIANTLNALANLDHYDDLLVSSLTASAITKANRFDPRYIATALNALCKLDYYDERFVNTFCSVAIMKIQAFNPQDISNTLNALSKFGHYDKCLVDSLCFKAVNKTEVFNSRDIANTLNALSKLSHNDMDLVNSLCAKAKRIVKEFDSQHISNILNSLVSLDHYDEELVNLLCSSLKPKLSTSIPQHFANVLKSLSKFNHYDETFVHSLCSGAISKTNLFIPQEIASTLSSLKSFAHHDKPLVYALCSSAKTKIHEFNAQNVSNTLNALSFFNHVDIIFFEDLCSAVILLSDSLDENTISNTLNSLSKLGYYDEALVKRFCSVSMNLSQTFTSQGIAQTLLALSSFNHYDRDLVDALCMSALTKIDTFNIQITTNTLYALCVFGHYSSEVWSCISDLQKESCFSIPEREKSQLHLIFLTLSLERPDLLSRLNVCDTFRNECYRSHVTTILGHKSSELHLRVSRVLDEIGIFHENECVANGGLSIDILINAAGSTREHDHSTTVWTRDLTGIVIEVDGPAHYVHKVMDSSSKENSLQMKGRYVLKNRLLKQYGYKIIYIPYFEWEALNLYIDMRKEYILHLLKGK